MKQVQATKFVAHVKGMSPNFMDVAVIDFTEETITVKTHTGLETVPLSDAKVYEIAE